MKLNKYFLIGAMGLGLFACSDDLDGNAGQDNGNKVQEGSTYAAFTIKFGNGSSRAIQPTEGEAVGAEGNEEYVSSATIIITKENDVIEHVLTKTDQDATTEKYVVQTTTGEKKVYAYLNQDNMDLPTKSDIGVKTWTGDNTDILAKKASDLGTYNASETGGVAFAMSSVEVAPLSVKAEVTRNEALTTGANNAIVTVERVVAKVTVELDENFETANENKFNLIKLTAQIGNPDNLEYKDGVLSTTTTGSYRMAYNNNGDRQTPYFSYPTSAIDWTSESVDFETEVYPSLLSGDEVEVTNGGLVRFYCLENTHAVGNYMNYNTTFVRLYAEMTPKNAESLAPAYTDGILTFAAVSETTESNTPETFYEISSAPEAYKNYVGKYVTATKMAAIYDAIVENGNVEERDGKADAVVAELNKMNISLVKYTDGVGNYYIWVNDQSTEDMANTAPVFRNDWYALNITKITLPGDPKNGFEPGPIHPDTHLAVKVNIKRWNKVSHDIVLGE